MPPAAQQPLVDARDVLEQGCGPRVQPLAQRWARRQQPDAQCFLEKLVAPIALDGVKVALALHQQPEISPNNVALLLTPHRTGSAASNLPHCGAIAFR